MINGTQWFLAIAVVAYQGTQHFTHREFAILFLGTGTGVNDEFFECFVEGGGVFGNRNLAETNWAGSSKGGTFFFGDLELKGIFENN